MIDLSATLRVVVHALDEVGAAYVIVGSTAAATWGVLRATRDVDVVTVVDTTSGAALIEQLQRTDVYVPVEDAELAVATGGSFNVLHPTSGGKVDLFVRQPDDEFTRSRLDRRVRAEVLGIQAWVASPEDVILAKLAWRKQSRSEVQWRDCVEIAATQQLDRHYLRRWATHLDVTDDLDDLLDVRPR